MARTRRTVEHTLNITGMIAALLVWLLKVDARLRILLVDFVVKRNRLRMMKERQWTIRQ